MVSMIYELEKGRYSQARNLVRPLEDYQPMCTAVLEGIHPGRVFVDDLAAPRTAFLSTFLNSEDEAAWGFLAGEADHDAFNRSLNQALFDRRVVGGRAPALLLTCAPQDWGGQVAAVLQPRPPIVARRRHYVCQTLRFDWRPHVPEGFAVEQLDVAFLDREDLRLPQDVQKTLEKWRSIADPRLKDYGFCIVHDGQVVSWATVDFVAAGTGDAGLFTLPAYRRRGLAAIATAAAIEYGLSHGLSAINWTCAEGNLGSIRTAEKLGFERGRDYIMYYLVFDEAQHLGTLAYTLLEEGEYAAAAERFEQAFAQFDEHQAWDYFDAARAWSALGDGEKAMACLTTAVDKGWTDAEGARRCKEFEDLHSRPEWAAVLQRMERQKGSDT
jgi:RimJ/RimL family protein N-acetyltransferase